MKNARSSEISSGQRWGARAGNWGRMGMFGGRRMGWPWEKRDFQGGAVRTQGPREDGALWASCVETRLAHSTVTAPSGVWEIPNASKSYTLSGSRLTNFVPGTGTGTSGQASARGAGAWRNAGDLICASETLELVTLWWNYIFVCVCVYIYTHTHTHTYIYIYEMLELLYGVFIWLGGLVYRILPWRYGDYLNCYCYIIQRAESLRPDRAGGKVLV